MNVCGVRLGSLTTSDDADGLLLFVATHQQVRIL